LAVKKLAEVEEAKELMTEAMDWSVFAWLFQKCKVREVADHANEAVDKLNRATKARWSDEIKTAYKSLSAKTRSKGDATDAEIQAFVKKVKDADDAARDARKDAEDTFAEAERQMNTGMAKEGCRKAIHQWELDAKAIRYAEAVPSSAKREK
jgi:hypothetical protein